MARSKKIKWPSNLELYRSTITFDFMMALCEKMKENNVSQKQLAEKLGKTEGFISQKLNDPGNLTFETMFSFAKALGLKISIVPYDDQDPAFEKMPIYSGMFAGLWEAMGRPRVIEEMNEIRDICAQCNVRESFLSELAPTYNGKEPVALACISSKPPRSARAQRPWQAVDEQAVAAKSLAALGG